MGRNDARRRAAHRRRVVADVLATRVAAHGCPCGWPQFEYWAAKKRRPRSMDDIQNELVAAALALPFYASRKPATPEYWLSHDVVCERCGARWKHFSEEWRMLAYHETLIRVPGVGATAAGDEAGARKVANLRRAAPASGPSWSLAEWAHFMLGRHYEIEPFEGG